MTIARKSSPALLAKRPLRAQPARIGLLLCGLVMGCSSATVDFADVAPERQFDFWLGDWSVRNVHRTSGNTWEFRDDALVKVRSVAGGRAIVEQWTAQGSGALRGFSLRTWDAQEKRWEIILNWHSGQPTPFTMMVGQFSDSSGEFYPPSGPRQVRFTFRDASAHACTWEQALSDDGKAWITNWIMEFSRTGPAAALSAENLPIASLPTDTSPWPGARQLDHLIGVWQGTVTHTMADGSTSSGTATRRVTPILDGLALMCLTTIDGGEESISVLAYDQLSGGWSEVGLLSTEADCHWQAGDLINGQLEMTEVRGSDNQIATTINNITPDAHTVTITLSGNEAPFQRRELRFERRDETGAVREIPEFDPTPLMKLGRVRSEIDAERFDSAEALLQEVIRDGGGNGRVYFELGYTQQAQGKNEAARKSYAAAVAASATAIPTVEYNLACMASKLGDADETFLHLQRAVEAGFGNQAMLKADPDFNNVRTDPRFAKFAGAAAADSFVEPTRVIHEIVGENAGDQFGWTARVVGDWDQDEVLDFVSTAPTWKGRGKVYVYSGRTGQELFHCSGKPGEQFGNNACGGGDVDQDGHVDLLVGAPNKQAPGNAYVYSGKDGTLLHHFPGEQPGDLFGNEVTALTDLDGDEHPEIFVGVAAGDGQQPKSGYGVVYSGKTGAELFRVDGEQTGDQFANAAGFMTNADGSATLAIGAQNAGENDRGRVYVYRLRGAAAERAFIVEGDGNSRNLGQMFVTSPGDNNADGFEDVYVSDFSDSTTVKGGGKVRIVSGQDGTDLLTISGENVDEGLGTSPSDAGDVNGDGAGDLVIGAWQNAEGAKSGGRVYLYDGKPGDLIRTWTCTTAGDTFGFDACGIGDVDGDGAIDFLLTSAWHNKKQGRVFVLAGGDADNSAKDSDLPQRGHLPVWSD